MERGDSSKATARLLEKFHPIGNEPTAQEVEQQLSLVPEAGRLPELVRAGVIKVCTTAQIDQERFRILLHGLNDQATHASTVANVVLWLAEYKGAPKLCYTWKRLRYASKASRTMEEGFSVTATTPQDLLGRTAPIQKGDIGILSARIHSKQEIGMGIWQHDVHYDGAMHPSTLPVSMHGDVHLQPLIFNGTTEYEREPAFKAQVLECLIRSNNVFEAVRHNRCLTDLVLKRPYAEPLKINRIILFGLKHVYKPPAMRSRSMGVNDFGELDAAEIFKLYVVRDLLYNLKKYDRPRWAKPVPLVICWPSRNRSPALDVICEKIFSQDYEYEFASEVEAWTAHQNKVRLQDTLIVSLSPHFPVRQMIADLSQDVEGNLRYPSAIICNTIENCNPGCGDQDCECEKLLITADPTSRYPFCYCRSTECRDTCTQEVIDLAAKYHSARMDPAYEDMRTVLGSITVYTSAPDRETMGGVRIVSQRE